MKSWHNSRGLFMLHKRRKLSSGICRGRNRLGLLRASDLKRSDTPQLSLSLNLMIRNEVERLTTTQTQVR